MQMKLKQTQTPGTEVLDDGLPVRGAGIQGGSTDGVRDYLQQIGKFPLLTADDEVMLAQRIEVGVLAQQKLDTEPDLPSELVRELRYLVQEGKTAHSRFLCSNLKLVVSVAKRYSGRGLPLMDLIQEGNIGLARAVEKFDYATGYKFSTYAMWWIRQAISRGVAETTRVIRVPVHTVEKMDRLKRTRREMVSRLGREATIEELAEETNFTCSQVQRLVEDDREPVSLHTPVGGEGASEFGDLIEDDDAPQPIDVVSDGLRHEKIHELVDALPDREADILRKRYGLAGAAPMTFDQIGMALGVTRERVRQIERRALGKLHCPQLEGYLDN